ncbi:25805_t:CDS:1, partial [Racocetra persica]
PLPVISQQQIYDIDYNEFIRTTVIREFGSTYNSEWKHLSSRW